MYDDHPSVVAVAHVLPTDVRHQLRALAEGQLLRKVFTGFVYQRDRLLERLGNTADKVLRSNLTAILSKRPELEGVAPSQVGRCIFPELIRTIAASRNVASQAVYDWTVSRVSAAAARALSDHDRIVIAREDEAYEAFAAATHRGLRCAYSLPTAHHRLVSAIMLSELSHYPDVESQSEHRHSMAEHRVVRKDAELAMSDKILVPSQFVKDSLIFVGIPPTNIHILPFAAETDWVSERPSKKSNCVLHVGQLSLRKGTHRLLRAWKSLGAYRTCELRLVGSMRLSPKFLSGFQGTYNYLGRLPRKSLRMHYSQALLFCLPALAEGFAMVILEAISCGTAVVVSRNSGAEGFLEDGREGLFHDAQNDEQLCAALDKMLSQPVNRREMEDQCLATARRWCWEDYRRAYRHFIRDAAGCDCVQDIN